MKRKKDIDYTKLKRRLLRLRSRCIAGYKRDVYDLYKDKPCKYGEKTALARLMWDTVCHVAMHYSLDAYIYAITKEEAGWALRDITHLQTVCPIYVLLSIPFTDGGSGVMCIGFVKDDWKHEEA